MCCMQLATITQRVNTVNGRRYSEDPAIFAWELCNECQCVLLVVSFLPISVLTTEGTEVVDAVRECLRTANILL